MSELPFWDHVEFLRKTLVRCALLVLVCFVTCFAFHKPLLKMALAPLQAKGSLCRERLLFEKIEAKSSSQFVLPTNATLLFASKNVQEVGERTFFLPQGSFVEIKQVSSPYLALSPLDGFTTALKVSFWTALCASSPLCLLLLMQFFAPALKSSERFFLLPFFVLSALFMSLGFVCAYHLTLPLVGSFFAKFNESVAQNLWALPKCVDFVLFLLFAHIFAFELFAGLFLLIHYHVISYRQLRRARPYVVVAIFLLAAILTPPDVLSQAMLAAPLLIFYELSLLYAKKREKAMLMCT